MYAQEFSGCDLLHCGLNQEFFTRRQHGANINFQGAIMLRTLANFLRFIENYRYYRQQGIHPNDAWSLAKKTLPG